MKQESIEVLIICFTIACLQGCTAYMWGKRWDVESAGQDKVSNSINVISKGPRHLVIENCAGSNLSITTNQTQVGSAIGPVFLPLSINHNEDRENDTLLSIQLEHLDPKAKCIGTTKQMFSLTLNGSVVDSFKFSSSKYYTNAKLKGGSYCSVVIETETTKLPEDEIVLKVSEDAFGCRVPDISIIESKYFCVKEARWGGTDC